MTVKQSNQTSTPDRLLDNSWISGVCHEMAGATPAARSRLRTTLQYKTVGNEESLLVPPELAEDQPDVLEYLHRFSSAHSLSLIEDRRRLALAPIVERRRSGTPNTAMAISLLLKQNGISGLTPTLSSPHMLRPGNLKIQTDKLLRMAAAVRDQSRKVQIIPGPFVRQNLLKKTDTLTVHACQLSLPAKPSNKKRKGSAQPLKESVDTQPDPATGENTDPVTDKTEDVTFAQFDSEGFHAIGYITNDQFVASVFLGGGPIARPQLWSSHDVMAETPFQCQVFPSPYPKQTYGLFYQTYYIDLQRKHSGHNIPVIHVA